MRSDKQKGSGRAAVRQLLVFDHLDRVAAPILASIAERVKSAAPGLLGVRLAFDKEVATSLQDNPAWRLARSELLSSLVAHVSHNPLLLGLEIPRMPLPAMYCHSLSAALRSGKGGPRKLQFLRMDGCRLSQGSVSALVPALIACVELRLLDLSSCGLRADAAKPLATLLQGHSRRRTAEQARAENERWFSSLRTREAEMPEAAAAPRGLETLILRDNELRDRGAATLGAALLEDRWLTSLDLRHNEIGAAALCALEEAASKAWEELARACGGPRCLLDGVELLLRRGVELVEDKTAELVEERAKLVELHPAAQPSLSHH